jgi:UDP-3-O-[3-hydroxymyristoyl] glucosamine N-acyltransferase
MKYTAAQIAKMINGTVDGDANICVNKLSKIEEGTTDSLSFLSNPKYEKFLYETQSSIVIINADFELKSVCKPTLIRVEDAYKSFGEILSFFNPILNNQIGISDKSVVEKSAEIGKEAYIGPMTYIGNNVKIGDNVKIFANCSISDNVTIDSNCVIKPNVTILENCEIGKDCTIHSGTVIGSDGFGFSPNSENNYKKIDQIGNVVIHDYVEIGANTTIDRATFGSTIIHKGVKLDNLIQIAHNVEIGKNTVIAAQTGIAGSTKIGDNCMFGGQVGVAGHLTITNGVKVAAQSGITKNIKEEGSIIKGTPAININDYNKLYVYFKKLPELANTIHKIQKKIDSFLNK